MKPQTVHFPTAIPCCYAHACWNSVVLSAVSSRPSSWKLTSVRGVQCFQPVWLHFEVGGVQSSTWTVQPVHDLQTPNPGRSYTFCDFAHLTGFRPCILYCSLVRLNLEYFSVMWSPYTRTNINKLETFCTLAQKIGMWTAPSNFVRPHLRSC